MSRRTVRVRDATPDDVSTLVHIYGSSARRSFPERSALQPAESEARVALRRITEDPDERLLVALLDGEPAGSVHLVRKPVSPVHNEPAVHVTHLHVLHRFRRQGVGSALVEAAITWAEQQHTSHLLATTSVYSREANRFLARLGLAQLAVVRGAPVTALRAKLACEAPAVARLAAARNQQRVGQVLAQRRSLRRAQARPQ